MAQCPARCCDTASASKDILWGLYELEQGFGAHDDLPIIEGTLSNDISTKSDS